MHNAPVRFAARSVIQAPPARVFAFHELPDAHHRLTPAWAGSRVIEHVPSLRVGARSVVAIRIAPWIWIRSEMRHIVHEPPTRFVDEQVRGPFRTWRHEHLMTAVENGTELADVIDFEPPMGGLGRWLAPLIILPRLRRLFAYRHEVTRRWCEGSE